MNASTITSDRTAIYESAPSADHFGKSLLLVNGTLLTVVALAASLADLAGYFLAGGPFAGSHTDNPIAVGSFEAHGLALIVAILLLANRNATGPAWNWTAAATHLLLGIANLLFWPVFTRYGLVPMGVVTTVVHAAFVALHLVAALWRDPRPVTRPGAVFRIGAAVTIATGVGLHVSRLPLGPELFQQTVLTPLVDVLFAVPMIITGIAGAVLLRRAVLPALWEKLAYGFVVLFFLGSIVIHAKTALTWDTSYLNSFPAWYPLAAVVYLSLIGLFAVTRQFRPARAP